MRSGLHEETNIPKPQSRQDETSNTSATTFPFRISDDVKERETNPSTVRRDIIWL